MPKILQLFLLILAILVTATVSKRRKKLFEEEDPLYTSWREFAELQINQSIEFNRDFPIDDRLYSNLKKCGTFDIRGDRMVDNLEPKDVQIYSEIGNLLTFCRVDLALPKSVNESLDMEETIEYFKKNCLQSTQTKTKNPTLPKILRRMGADLQIVESNVLHKNLQAWTRHVIHLIEKIDGYQDKWKMVLIAPGLFDLKLGMHTHHLAHAVLQSIQLINYKLPDKTIVVVIRNSRQDFWKALTHEFPFCEKIHSLWSTHEGKSEEVWNVLDERLKKNYCTETFCAQMLSFLDDSRPLKTAKITDISPVSSDCIHFSSRGLSLLHVHLWNWLVQPSRQTEWTPLVRPLYCPRPGCPYFVTKTNTYFCPQSKRIDPQQESKDLTDFLILSMLLATIILYALLLAYMVWN